MELRRSAGARRQLGAPPTLLVARGGDRDDGLRWESTTICMVSRCGECGPSPGWQGRHSPEARIDKSGLWLVQGLYKQRLSEGERAERSEMVRAGLGSSGP